MTTPYFANSDHIQALTNHPDYVIPQRKRARLITKNAFRSSVLNNGFDKIVLIYMKLYADYEVKWSPVTIVRSPTEAFNFLRNRAFPYLISNHFNTIVNQARRENQSYAKLESPIPPTLDHMRQIFIAIDYMWNNPDLAITYTIEEGVIYNNIFKFEPVQIKGHILNSSLNTVQLTEMNTLNMGVNVSTNNLSHSMNYESRTITLNALSPPQHIAFFFQETTSHHAPHALLRVDNPVTVNIRVVNEGSYLDVLATFFIICRIVIGEPKGWAETVYNGVDYTYNMVKSPVSEVVNRIRRDFTTLYGVHDLPGYDLKVSLSLTAANAVFSTAFKRWPIEPFKNKLITAFDAYSELVADANNIPDRTEGIFSYSMSFVHVPRNQDLKFGKQYFKDFKLNGMGESGLIRFAGRKPGLTVKQIANSMIHEQDVLTVGNAKPYIVINPSTNGTRSKMCLPICVWLALNPDKRLAMDKGVWIKRASQFFHNHNARILSPGDFGINITDFCKSFLPSYFPKRNTKHPHIAIIVYNTAYFWEHVYYFDPFTEQVIHSAYGEGNENLPEAIAPSYKIRLLRFLNHVCLLFPKAKYMRFRAHDQNLRDDVERKLENRWTHPKSASPEDQKFAVYDFETHPHPTTNNETIYAAVLVVPGNRVRYTFVKTDVDRRKIEAVKAHRRMTIHTTIYDDNICDRFIKAIKHHKQEFHRSLLYAHNGGGFDLKLLMRHFIENNGIFIGKAISSMTGNIIRVNVIFFDTKVKNDKGKLENLRITMSDSMGIFAGQSLGGLTKSFNVKHKKLTEEFDVLSVTHDNVLEKTVQGYPYLLNDGLGLYEILDTFQKEMMAKGVCLFKAVTGTSISLSIFLTQYYKPHIAPIRNLTHSIDMKIRVSYYGGRCECLRQIGIINEHTIPAQYTDRWRRYPMYDGIAIDSVDINSSYPFSMTNDLPVGDPTHVSMAYDKIAYTSKECIIYGDYKQVVRGKREKYTDKEAILSEEVFEEPFFGFVMCLVKGGYSSTTRFPIIPYKIRDRTCFPEFMNFTKVVLFSSSIDYILSKGLKYTIVCYGGYHFKKFPIFKEFITTMYNQRLIAKQNKDVVKSYLLKILMNSLYGRCGIKRDRDGLMFYKKEDKVKERFLNELLWKGFVNKVFFHGNQCIVSEKTFLDVNMSSVALASAISAYARIHLTDMIYTLHQNGFYPFYCDTDSITVAYPRHKVHPRHYLEKVVKISPYLGGWDYEGEEPWDSSYLLGCKMYYHFSSKNENVKHKNAYKGYNYNKKGNEISRTDYHHLCRGGRIKRIKFDIIAGKKVFFTEANFSKLKRVKTTYYLSRPTYTKGEVTTQAKQFNNINDEEVVLPAPNYQGLIRPPRVF